jgi:hypothetical protein
VLCFVSIGDHLIEISKVTHMVSRGLTVDVHLAGGGSLELGPEEASALLDGMDALARGGAIRCVDARRAARPAPPCPPAPVPVETAPPSVQPELPGTEPRAARGKRPRPAAALQRKVSA